MQRSPGERPKPQLTEAEFHDAIGPLVRNCSGAEFTADRAKDYYILLQFVPAKFLRAAVVEYLRTATEAWFPMPRVLLDLARKAKRADTERRIAIAPPCETCGCTGLVTARPRGSEVWAAFACCCVRGMQFRAHAKYDESTMETWRDQSRLVHSAPVAVLPLHEMTRRIGNIPELSAKEQP